MKGTRAKPHPRPAAPERGVARTESAWTERGAEDALRRAGVKFTYTKEVDETIASVNLDPKLNRRLRPLGIKLWGAVHFLQGKGVRFSWPCVTLAALQMQAERELAARRVFARRCG